MLLDIRSASGGVVGFGAGVSANSVSSLMPLPFQQLIAIVAEGTVLFLVLYVAACGILRLVPAGRQLAQLIWSSQVVEWFVTAAIGLAAIALLVGLVQLGWAAIQGKVSSFWVVLAFRFFTRGLSTPDGFHLFSFALRCGDAVPDRFSYWVFGICDHVSRSLCRFTSLLYRVAASQFNLEVRTCPLESVNVEVQFAPNPSDLFARLSGLELAHKIQNRLSGRDKLCDLNRH